MSLGVEFDADELIMADKGLKKPSERKAPKGVVGWLLRKKIIKDESQGRYVLFAVIFVDFLIAGAVYYFFIL